MQSNARGFIYNVSIHKQLKHTQEFDSSELNLRRAYFKQVLQSCKNDTQGKVGPKKIVIKQRCINHVSKLVVMNIIVAIMLHVYLFLSPSHD